MKIIITLLLIQFGFLCVFGLDCSGQHEFEYQYTPVCPLNCLTLHTARCSSYRNVSSCQCTDGTIRDTASGKCIAMDQCPKQTKQQPIECKVNERYAESVSACPTSCEHPVGPVCGAIIHKPSCVCISGTVRDKVNNVCVKFEDCPKP
ncbi:unnamed protein product [Oppiella nova]|uniref:TIL domain-containing protein n=1 Tax=Oppiella nova TaxID=334625 RepID=A0A7R9M8P7_9ACAR|nr:unnamed protein product [Oppiella nova]CAG2172877.1 unnamed protein product [Oppiella nova]